MREQIFSGINKKLIHQATFNKKSEALFTGSNKRMGMSFGLSQDWRLISTKDVLFLDSKNEFQ